MHVYSTITLQLPQTSYRGSSSGDCWGSIGEGLPYPRSPLVRSTIFKLFWARLTSKVKTTPNSQLRPGPVTFPGPWTLTPPVSAFGIADCYAPPRNSCNLPFCPSVADRTSARNSSRDEITNVNVNFFTATSSTTFKQCAPEATEFGEITQINGHYAIQGHRFWYQSKAHTTSY